MNSKTKRWFYLSFIDGEGFLGAAIVRAHRQDRRYPAHQGSRHLPTGAEGLHPQRCHGHAAHRG